jgi:hypothetical protein
MTDVRCQKAAAPADPAAASLLISDLCSSTSEPHAPKLHDSRKLDDGSRGPRAPAPGSPRRHLPSVLCPLRPCGPLGRLARPGDHSAREPPDPIPNSAVKPCCAQGTALRRVGERVVARPGEAPKRPAGPQRSEGGQRSEVRAQRACPRASTRGSEVTTRQHQPPPALPGSPAPPPAVQTRDQRSAVRDRGRPPPAGLPPPRRTTRFPPGSDIRPSARCPSAGPPTICPSAPGPSASSLTSDI